MYDTIDDHFNEYHNMFDYLIVCQKSFLYIRGEKSSSKCAINCHGEDE